jgi:Phosphotransferase enzyme family
VRYTVAARHMTGEPGRSEKVFYAKAYPERDAARGMFDYLRELADYARTSNLGIRIDSPIACIDRLSAVVLAAGRGRPLSDIVADAPEADAIEAVREAARAVARFNLSDAPTVRSYSAADYLASLDRPMAHLRCASPALDQDLRQIRDHAASTLRDVPGRPTHRDMKPEHVLLGPGGPALIDLDSCASADPLLDPALMLARFAGLHSSDTADGRMNALSSAFAGEYFACVPGSWRGRLPLYYATSLMEVAAGLFHRQESDWQRRATSLVRAAADITAGGTPLWLRHCP